MIKPIETEYDGYKFRSRLEARWAVFFDTLGIEWEYEPEGFEFDGIKYLPDFYLEDLGIWCEIKGKLEQHEKWSEPLRTNTNVYPELDKASKFRDNNNAIAVVIGTPGSEWVAFYGFDSCDSSCGTYNDEDAEWIIAEDGKPALSTQTSRSDRTIYSDGDFNTPLPRMMMKKHKNSDNMVAFAIRRARAARFETR